MTALSEQANHRRRALTLAIGGPLYLVYFLTFSGTIGSDDERYIIDAVDSLAIHGNLRLSETYYLRISMIGDVEPAQPFLAAPLYWLAHHIPWIGNVHTVYLCVSAVTVLTAILLFH